MNPVIACARPGVPGRMWAFACASAGVVFNTIAGTSRRMRQRLAVAALLSFALIAPAHAQVMTFTGASPATFSGPGQIITFSMTFSQSNAITQSIALDNMSIPASNLSCAGLPLPPLGSTTCTFTYTTTSSNTFDVVAFGSYVATDPNGGVRSGAISNQQRVTYAPSPQASISVAPSSVIEDAGPNLVFTISLNRAATADTTVNFATGGSATPGSDYAAVGTSVLIPAGASSATVVVDPIADSSVEPDEQVTIALAPGSGYGVGTPQTASGLILNDDPVPSLSINSVNVPEGNSGTTGAVFTVTLNSASDRAVTVNYATANGTAVAPGDFAATSGTLTFAPGETRRTIVVAVTGDGVVEADETFTVGLSAATNATIAAATGTGVIVNDDVSVTVAPAGLPGPTVGAAYSQTLTASGGTAPYSFAITAGALPAGLSLSTGGTLSGTVTTGGTFNFTVTATDSAGVAGSRAYTLAVGAPVVSVAPATLPAGSAGTAYSQSLSASGGTAPYSWAVTAGALPPGLSLSANGTLGGTPAAGGTFNFTLTATDSSSGTGPYTGSRAYSLQIIATVPGAPVIGTATAGDTQATISFSAPASNGGSAITGYTVTASPGGMSASGSGSPITLTGLDNGIAYTFTVTATNAAGTGPASAASNSVMPAAAQTIFFSNPGPQNFGTTPTLTATSDSGLTPTFTSSSPGVCTITSGGALTFVSAGNCTINADQAGNGSYLPAPQISRTFTVNAVAPGAPVIGTATAGDATATVTFVAPAFNGGSAITGYTVTSSPGGITATGNGSPLDITGLTNGVAYTFTVTATNAAGTGPASVASNSVTPAPPLSLDPTPLADATVASAYSGAIIVSGGLAPHTFAVSAGALPAGITLSTSGLLSGTPSAGGSFNFSVTVTDALGSSDTRSYTLTVTAATVALTPATLPSGTNGTAYSQTVSASGGTAPYTYAVTAGALPAGMALSAGGVLSGMPTRDGSFSFTITAADSSTGNGPFSGSRAYTLTIAIEAPSANPVSASVAFNSAASPITLDLGGGAADAVTVASAPSNGSAVASGTGISYQPDPGFSGSDTFTYTATNASGTSAPATVSITVGAPALVIADGGPADGIAGQAFTRTFRFSGGTAPYTALDVAGLPAGIAVSGSTADSITVSGTPTATGSFSLVVSGTDSSTGDGPFDAVGTFALGIASPALALAPADASLAAAYLASFSQAFTASGGNGPYVYAYTGGAVPGLALRGDTLSGTPSAPGIYRFSITATDTGTTGSTVTVVRDYTLTVADAVIGIDPASLADGNVGVAYAAALTATGGLAPYRFTVSAGRLPDGLDLTADGTLAGTPAAVGSFDFTVTATDANGPAGTRDYTLVIGAAAPAAVADAATTLAGEAVTIEVAANDTGTIDSIAITRAPDNGTATVDGLAIVYTPAAGFAGNDTLSYTAQGPGGTSAAVVVSITVNAVPVLVSREMSAMAGIPVQVDLTEGATGGPFTAATLVSLSPASSGEAAVRAGGSGYVLDFTPDAMFTGQAVVRFTVANANATSAVSTITFIVSARPDPSQDAEVLGAIDAQVESTKRFATAQIGNFQQRLEQLHSDRSSNGFTSALGLQSQRLDCEQTPGRRSGHCDRAMTGGVDAGDPVPGMSADGSVAPGAAQPDRLLGVWVGGMIRSGDIDSGEGRSGVDFESDGISVGVDFRVNERLVLGGGIGYGQDRNDVGIHGSTVDGDARTLAMYGSFHPGNRLFANGLIGYQQLSYDLQRYLTGTGGFVAGQRDGEQWFASLSAGADFTHRALQLTSYGRLDVGRATLDGYTETGDPFLALRHGAMEVDSSTGSLGMHLRRGYALGWGQLTPMLRLEYQHDFGGRSRSTVQYADLSGGPLYPVEDADYNRNRWNLGMGLLIAAPLDWSLRVEYRDTLSSEGLDEHGVTVNAQKQF